MKMKTQHMKTYGMQCKLKKLEKEQIKSKARIIKTRAEIKRIENKINETKSRFYKNIKTPTSMTKTKNKEHSTN